MFNAKIYCLLFTLWASCASLLNCHAQSLYGVVKNQKNEALDGANVFWLNSNIGTYTGQMGDFTIEKDPQYSYLVASYIGYTSDTIAVENQKYLEFKLQDNSNLNEVVIAQQRDGVEISSIDAIKTENITSTELRKAACCELAGCFETQNTVAAKTTNFITNAKELRILGLAGVYTQTLLDGVPLFQGLSFTYGINGVPGSLINNIYVAKGANSVLQGFESMSGQINVITQDPSKAEKLFLNTYINSFGTKHLNANFAFTKNKWSNLTAFHTAQPPAKFDRDKDTFLDLPQLTRYMLFNKTQYGSDRNLGFNAMLTLRFLNENINGGQVNFDSKNDNSLLAYGQKVAMNQPEISLKTGYRLSDLHNFTAYAALQYHNQNSLFGTINYDAQQLLTYLNFQYDFNYKKSSNFKTGISHRGLDLKETIDFKENSLNRTFEGIYHKKESILGVFAENNLELFNDKLQFIAGLRADYHNIYGVIFTPRTLLKYTLSPNTVLRASVGKGWRSVNLFSENIGLLSSSRDIVFEQTIDAEKALNFGINYTQKISFQNVSGYITADLYRTQFESQFFPDYDTDPTKAFIRNFDGESASNAFQIEANINTFDKFDWKLGYNFLDVYQKIEGNERMPLPFNSKHKLLATFGYQPLNKKFQIDLNAHWYSAARLPDTSSNPEPFQRADYAKAYALLNAQVTYIIKQFEVYLGCENIFDFRQKQPIINWQNPFNAYFDTASVWGPTKGREFYLGVRFKIE